MKLSRQYYRRGPRFRRPYYPAVLVPYPDPITLGLGNIRPAQGISRGGGGGRNDARNWRACLRLAVLLDYHDQPDVTVYTVSHYLDDDQVTIMVQRGTDSSSLTELDGETDPRKIVEKLGLPVEYMFP